MPLSARSYLGVAIGATMVGLGIFIIVRLLALGLPPLTGRLWLDLAFAALFLARGGMYLARARRVIPPPGEPPAA